MGLHFHRQAIDIGSGTGTQDFTVSGIGTPVAAIFTLSTPTANGADANHVLLMEGYSDGTNHCCGATTSERGVSTTNTWTKIVNDAPVITIDPNTGAIDGIGEFDSFITDGVRLDFTDLPPAAYLLHICFVVEEGTGYDVAVGSFDSGSDSSKNIGFEPDIIRAFGVHNSYSSGFTGVATTSGDAQGNMSIGLLGRGQGQGSIGWFDEDAITTGGAGATSHSIIDNANIGDDGLESATDLTTTATGFNISPGTFGQFVGFLAIKFNGNNQFKFGEIDTPTSTGSQAITGVGFQPSFVMELHSTHTAYNTALDDDGFSFGMSWMHGETNNDHALMGRTSHAADPTTGKCRSVQNIACLMKDFSDDAGPGSLLSATFTSFDSDGYTKNFTAAGGGTARKALYLAIGPPPSTGGSLARRRMGLCETFESSDPTVRTC